MSPRISIGGDGRNSVGRALLAVLVGVAVVGYGGYDYVQQSDAVENAVEVEATIVETGVETSSSRRGSTDYRPTVTFEYRYEGTNYTGNDVHPATTQSDYDTRSAAESVVAPYEPGDTVTAYVDPDSPSDGFLEAEESSAPVKVMGIGALFVLLGVVSALRS